MKEIRTAEIRAAEGDALSLVGRPIVFDTPTKIGDEFGGYTEIIERGALDGADLSDIHLLYNHDLNKVPLARTPKTMTVEVDPAGMTFKANLPDTQEARAVYESVKRGDLSGMSFAFKVPDDGDEWDGNNRIIHKIAKVYECSIVPFPAYPTTSVEARNARKNLMTYSAEKDKAKIFINQILKRGL